MIEYKGECKVTESAKSSEKELLTPPVWSRRIHELRISQGMTQERLASLLGSDVKSIRRWEKGSASPRIYHRQQLADVLGVSLIELGFFQELLDEEGKEAIIEIVPDESSVSNVHPDESSTHSESAAFPIIRLFLVIALWVAWFVAIAVGFLSEYLWGNVMVLIVIPSTLIPPLFCVIRYYFDKPPLHGE